MIQACVRLVTSIRQGNSSEVNKEIIRLLLRSDNLFTNICMTNIALQVRSNTPLNSIIIIIRIVIGIEYYVKRLNTY